MPRRSRYEFPEGFHVAHLYPVDGESAIAELWHGETVWGQVQLRDIDRDAVGEDRVATASATVLLYAPPEGSGREWWEFDLGEVERQLRLAREWLLDNERKCVPVDDDGLSAAGSAFSKIAADDPLWHRSGGDSASG